MRRALFLRSSSCVLTQRAANCSRVANASALYVSLVLVVVGSAATVRSSFLSISARNSALAESRFFDSAISLFLQWCDGYNLNLLCKGATGALRTNEGLRRISIKSGVECGISHKSRRKVSPFHGVGASADYFAT